MTRPLLIIKTGTTLQGLGERRGDFEQWIADSIADDSVQILVREVWRGEPLPAPGEILAAIITGSPAMVTDQEPWSEYTAEWLGTAVQSGLPTFGICYGHQLLAHALGGRVDYHPRGREIGTVEICLNKSVAGDQLFGEYSGCFPVHVSHSQTVIELPAAAVVLAANDFEPNHIVRYSQLCWGVQYHPEFDEDIMRAYIEGRQEALLSEGLDPQFLLEHIVPAEQAETVLRRFLAVARAAAGQSA